MPDIEKELRHVYWFAPYDLTCPSSRYRGKLPLEHLEKWHGISFDFIMPKYSVTGLVSFLSLWFEILFFRKENSLIVIQKICTNRLYANALKVLIYFKRKDTLYDMDDAEFLRYPVGTLHFFLKRCASVAVGSKALHDYCKTFNANIYIQPSPVVPRGSKRPNQKTGRLKIGWVGDFGNDDASISSFSHKTSLYTLLFPQICKMETPLRLTLIGVKNASDIPELQNYFRPYPHIELVVPEGLSWENDEWLYPLISEFDVGVSPLVDHLFNRAKSAFRAKQYLSCGVPVVLSDVGENGRVIQNGVTGFVCTKPEEFISSLRQIADMSTHDYEELSLNAYLSSEKFSIDQYCSILLENFNPK